MLFKILSFITTILLCFGCSLTPEKMQKNISVYAPNTTDKITLSHVNAYLQIGSVKQAEERFNAIKNPYTNIDAILTLINLRIASNDPVGAQQTFLSAIKNNYLDSDKTTKSFVEYFCQKREWQVLEAYGKSLINTDLPIESKNSRLTPIAQCFYEQQQWDKAKFWLTQLDFNQPLTPEIYLAISRVSVDERQYSLAQIYIDKFEKNKTNVTAKTLWTTIEIYQALDQSKLANKSVEHLHSLFPNNQYANKYQPKVKREYVQALVQTDSPEIIPLLSEDKNFHIIKKGETLYQLTQKYKVTVAQLLAWNANLDINKISIGTKIKLEPEQN